MKVKVYCKDDVIHLSDSVYRAMEHCLTSYIRDKHDREFLNRMYVRGALLSRNDLDRLVGIIRLIGLPYPLSKTFDADVAMLIAMVKNRHGLLCLDIDGDVTVATFFSTLRKGQQPTGTYLTVQYSCSHRMLQVDCDTVGSS